MIKKAQFIFIGISNRYNQKFEHPSLEPIYFKYYNNINQITSY